MKTIVFKDVSVTGNNFTIRQAGFQAELVVDGTHISVNFHEQSYVVPFINKIINQYDFVKRIN